MIMANALFRQLKADQGEACQIDVLAPAWSLPLLARMDEVQHGIAADLHHGELKLASRLKLGARLRAGDYDRAIVLPGSIKSAIPPWIAGIPERTGYRREWRPGLVNDLRPLDARYSANMLTRYLALARPHGAPLPTAPLLPRLRADSANQAALRARLGLSETRSAIAIMPAAEFGTAKRWPPGHYATLAHQHAQRGRDIWVLGGQGDHATGETVGQAFEALGPADGQFLNLCGQTRLIDAIDLLALAEQAIGNDSGLMHMAAAVGTRVTAIYGSTPVRFAPPLTDDTRRRLVFRPMDCAPCMERNCPLQHHDCMEKLTPLHVGNAFSQPDVIYAQS